MIPFNFTQAKVIGISWSTEGTQKMNAKCFPTSRHHGTINQKHLPKGNGSEILVDLMGRSREILSSHDINKVRVDLEENPANMIWLWGQGHRPNMPTFKERFNLTGAVITAVDLIKGYCLLSWMGHYRCAGRYRLP